MTSLNVRKGSKIVSLCRLSMRSPETQNGVVSALRASSMIGLNLSGCLFEERKDLCHSYVVFRELDNLDELHSDPKIQSACCVSVQDCAIAHHAPRMLTPDSIWSEVVADCDGSALALEPEERRVPMTLVRAAPLDADFGVCE